VAQLEARLDGIEEVEGSNPFGSTKFFGNPPVESTHNLSRMRHCHRAGDDYNRRLMPRITFLGAAGTVTGSKYLVEANGKRLLIDCGLFQGTDELTQRNWQRCPQDPATIDFVVLTHAHLDHTGYLPRLVSDGFRGPIFANAATQELCSLLLPDSAHLMEEDAEHATTHGYSSHKPALPLYTQEQALATLKRFTSMPRLGECRISPEFLIRSHDAGHILGSSSLELVITESGKNTTILFSGDVGRYDQPLLKDPEKPPRADFVLCESTYGDRDHPTTPPPDEALAEVINRVAHRGGVIVVPAFAVDRTQLLIYDIRQLERSKRIPVVPIYMDSPMAIDVTEIYRRHREDLKIGTLELQADSFSIPAVHVMRSPEQSKQINSVNTPAIIISASGMATGGRVLHHLEQRLPDSRNCVLLAGFQAQGTRGRALEDGAKSIQIHGQSVPVRAEVENLRQFSAHAGRSELMRWLRGIPAPPRQLFLVHGEPAAAQALGSAVQSELHWPVTLPNYLQSFDLNS
jgi:metallo-beta-lactamase family protein